MSRAATWFRSAAIVLAMAVTAHASNLSECRIAMGEAGLRDLDERVTYLDRCLRRQYYPDCGRYGIIGSELSRSITDAGSACQAAVTVDGVTADQLAPAPAPASWSDCDTRHSGIADIYDAAAAQRCLQRGLEEKRTHDFDFPAVFDSSVSARCASRAHSAYRRTVRAAYKDVLACARDAGEPPWSCAMTTTEGSLARILERFGARIARCEEALAVPDSPVRAMCRRAVVTTADLEQCLSSAAICAACQSTNASLGLAQDCAALSGDDACDVTLDDTFGLPEAGTLVVTNEGEDSITRFDSYLVHAGGSLAAATTSVGDGPVDVAIDGGSGRAYVVNGAGASVTMVDAGTGAYVGGSLAAATVAVGTAPTAVVVHSGLSVAYVANGGDDTVTLLDASDGAYLFGSLAASSLPTGDGPSAVAINEDEGILYVANENDDTVTFLGAHTGLPYYGTMGASTFAVGDRPQHLVYQVTNDDERLVVTNYGDGSVTALDPVTGQPHDGTLAASTRVYGAGAVATARTWDGVEVVGLAGSAAVAAHAEVPDQTVLGPISDAWLDAGAAPSDVELGSEVLVSLPSEDRIGVALLQGEYSLLGTAAAQDSMLLLPSDARGLLASNVDGRFFAGGFGGMQIVDLVTESIVVGPDVSDGSSAVAYRAAGDTVYTYDGPDLLFLDGTTGEYKFGDRASSAFPTGCGSFASIAASEAAGTVYVRCGDDIVYFDAATGAYRNGTLEASTITIEELRGLIVDDPAGVVFVLTGDLFLQDVVALDPVAPAYANGTSAASTLLDGVIVRRWAVHPGNGALYRYEDDGTLVMHDAADGTVLASTVLEGGVDAMVVNAAGNRLYAFRDSVYRGGIEPTVDDLVYLTADTLDLVGADIDSSTLTLGRDTSGHVVAFNAATGMLAALSTRGNGAVFGDALMRLDPDVPGYLGTDRLFHRYVDTGDAPSAIAVMPWTGF